MEFYGASRFLVDFNIENFRAIWKSLIERGAGVIFIDEREGKITGTIGAVVHPDGYSKQTAVEEMFWFVRSACRGGGLALYRALEAWARARGAAVIRMVHLLDVMPEKVSDFYRRVGFEAIEVHYSKLLA